MSSNGEQPVPWAQGGELSALNLKLITRVGLAVAAVALVVGLLWIAKDIYTDWLWFDAVEFLDVYQKILGMRIWLFFSGTILVAALLVVNLYIAYRFSRGESILPVPPEVYNLGRFGIIAGAVLTVFIMSIVFGIVAQGRWETFLLYMNRVSFGVEDPQFHKDMSFHVAVMPMLHFIQGWFMGVVIAIMVAVVALYLAIFGLRGVRIVPTPQIKAHIAILAAFLMVAIAAAHYLDIFELVFSGRGAAPGAGYTDVNARLPVLWILVAISLVSALGFIVSIWYGGVRLMVAAFSLWAVLAILAGAIYPTAFQRFRVNPNEFEREEQYIQRAISATAFAYDLEQVDERSFEYNPSVDAEILAANHETIQNVRLWDHRPLRDTYNQIQTFRQYYNFVGVDVDRYTFPDGQTRQVMLSARELFPENLELDAQNWVNRKLSYTHGYGAAVSPVTEITEEGRPEFFLQDIPSSGDFTLNRPEIYYGENTKSFIFVNSNTPEFNFPGLDGEPVFANYEGSGGVKISSFFRRIAYSWELLDFNLLISGQITSDSRVQYRREISDRVSTIAPFLKLDNDPYLVIGENGKLWWIQDAYTVTDRFAYSQAVLDEFNYIRNTVKVVIDAYNGTVHLFVIEPEEPLIQMYRKAFPSLFKDIDAIDELDPALKDHIRYPMDLFTAQTGINLRYHMRDPQVFFQKEDLWAQAQEVFIGNTQVVEPYYIMMKLPGETKQEFVLLLPFTPGGEERKNMVAWMAARSDGDNYGKLLTFIFPKGSQVDGPEQVEGRITNDEEIGREFTLICGGDKQCIRGNLLAIPMGEESQSILYVEPLYIRAEALAFPELKKVIVADSKNVVMTDTLCESLRILVQATDLGQACLEEPPPDEVPGPGIPGPGTTPVDIGEIDIDLGDDIGLIGDAVDELRENLTALEEALQRINEALEEGGTQ